ncbi:Gfo/Idh/MocA family protein [Segetibacter koreensis]|uniref:Gfo/Idh/MocA family protein n=1 Tax=Segetibacter koreensis TaxID=398037 RepID=UPI0003624BDC|nr:Gfo/Idh/MocA family oxidoreductase [Segetibacter koreensis]
MEKRRDFIKKGIMGTAGIAIGGMGFSTKSYASILGANDRMNIAVVGIRGRGVSHIEAYCKIKDSHNVRLKTLCDTDEQFFAPRSKMVVDKGGSKPLTEWDMHKVLDDKEIDAVSFATPNHWHALGTIWACQAGKHVYVEKPAMHDIWEGKKMIEASRKYNKRVQVGFQNRSITNVMEAIKFLHDGGIGKVYMARGLCIKPRDSFGIAKDSTPPATLHYDRWLGPAPYRPYNEKRSHYNWHWFWDTGNGDTGNQGPHQFDVARWGLNKNEHPISVYSAGGIYGINPDECAQETPNTQSSLFKYKDGTMLEFETRGRYSNDESSLDTRIGNIFYGTDGYLEINGETWKAFRKQEKVPFAGSKAVTAEKNEDVSHTGSTDTEHFINFIDAVRSGKSDSLHCDINEGFMSTVLPLLANISYRRQCELKLTGGDLEKESIINNPEASAMLTRQYRSPYVVPDQV